MGCSASVFFCSKLITRYHSCYQCPYGSGGHCGDITIGDFHEIDKYVNGINRFDGVSTVLTNTQKGEKLWKKIEGGICSKLITSYLDFLFIFNIFPTFLLKPVD